MKIYEQNPVCAPYQDCRKNKLNRNCDYGTNNSDQQRECGKFKLKNKYRSSPQRTFHK
jgi:hypothetical protein